MRRGKVVVRPLSAGAVEPFLTAEEAWFWYASCQLARNEGARSVAGCGEVARPCDPDDVYRAAIALHRRGVLLKGHLSVLGRFGLRLSPPDPWAGDGAGDACLWGEAMDRLTTVLRGKGIVL